MGVVGGRTVKFTGIQDHIAEQHHSAALLRKDRPGDRLKLEPIRSSRVIFVFALIIGLGGVRHTVRTVFHKIHAAVGIAVIRNIPIPHIVARSAVLVAVAVRDPRACVLLGGKCAREGVQCVLVGGGHVCLRIRAKTDRVSFTGVDGRLIGTDRASVSGVVVVLAFVCLMRASRTRTGVVMGVCRPRPFGREGVTKGFLLLIGRTGADRADGVGIPTDLGTGGGFCFVARVGMPRGGNGSLRRQGLAAVGTFFAYGQAALGTGGRLTAERFLVLMLAGDVTHLAAVVAGRILVAIVGVALGGDRRLCRQDLATVGAFFACGQTRFGAGGRLAAKRFLVFMLAGDVTHRAAVVAGRILVVIVGVACGRLLRIGRVGTVVAGEVGIPALFGAGGGFRVMRDLIVSCGGQRRVGRIGTVVAGHVGVIAALGTGGALSCVGHLIVSRGRDALLLGQDLTAIRAL